MNRLKNIKSLLFVDEIKFSKNNNDIDDSFYFIGVLVDINSVFSVQEKFESLTSDLQKGFHATRAYRTKNPNSELMNNLTELIIRNKLKCLVFKYDKNKFYDSTKTFGSNSNFQEKKKFKNHEFQALFYFMQTLEHYLHSSLDFVETPLRIYFDRGIYGVKQHDEFEFDSKKIETITFCSKKKIDLLALPDHVGYLFAKFRLKYNSINDSKNELINSDLFNNCILNFKAIYSKELFKFIDIDVWLDNLKHDISAETIKK